VITRIVADIRSQRIFGIEARLMAENEARPSFMRFVSLILMQSPTFARNVSGIG
jgi:hypothetical protein